MQTFMQRPLFLHLFYFIFIFLNDKSIGRKLTANRKDKEEEEEKNEWLEF